MTIVALSSFCRVTICTHPTTGGRFASPMVALGPIRCDRCRNRRLSSPSSFIVSMRWQTQRPLGGIFDAVITVGSTLLTFFSSAAGVRFPSEATRSCTLSSSAPDDFQPDDENRRYLRHSQPARCCSPLCHQFLQRGLELSGAYVREHAAARVPCRW
jgi:hypothetical protein